MRFISRLRDLFASFGFVDGCLFACSRLAEIVFHGRVRIIKYYFTVQSIVPPESDARQRSTLFTFSWADGPCPSLLQAERPPAVIAARFAQGARCLVAIAGDDRLAGFLWFVRGPYDEDEVRARFVPQPDGAAAWDFDVTIMPPYRMGRLFGYLWARASIELAACGVRHTMSRVSAFNPASISAHRRLGATIAGKALFVCFGSLQLMKASLRPRWHLSWRDDQRPVVAIAAERALHHEPNAAASTSARNDVREREKRRSR